MMPRTIYCMVRGRWRKMRNHMRHCKSILPKVLLRLMFLLPKGSVAVLRASVRCLYVTLDTAPPPTEGVSVKPSGTLTLLCHSGLAKCQEE